MKKMVKNIKKKELTDTDLIKIKLLFKKYQKQMKLQDWNIIVQQDLVENDTEYATIKYVDIRDRYAQFTMTTAGYKYFSWDRLVIHELTHILLREWREKFFQLVKNRDTFIEKEILKLTKKSKIINWANQQTSLIEFWIDQEEEKICTTMEHILTYNC